MVGNGRLEASLSLTAATDDSLSALLAHSLKRCVAWLVEAAVFQMGFGSLQRESIAS